jgi:uncharacterized MAPEG superfamily protein
MTAAHWCILIAALLPYPFAILAKAGGNYSNHNPRNEAVWAEGFRSRAHGAQMNAFEAFPPFAAAVLMAVQLGAGRETLNILAVAWLALRVLYGGAYLMDWPFLRSTIWTLAFAINLGIFLLSAFAY